MRNEPKRPMDYLTGFLALVVIATVLVFILTFAGCDFGGNLFI
jgi:hypothetical protein